MVSLQGARSIPRQHKYIPGGRSKSFSDVRRVACPEPAVLCTRAQATGTTTLENECDARWNNVKEGQWQWNGHNIRYGNAAC